ncbi:MAG: DUF6530 family protein [Gracilibacteraceae bacterium]|jgi:hypothetical protein|nr:DUF6530 family protein [Gracilibacteraceae bacterium]
MKIPTELKHKPVVVSEDYDQIDGGYSGNSDAKGLSVGLAQWNDRGKVDASAKVWRHTGGKWSNTSEELPLHRALDLAILICRTEQYFRGTGQSEKLYDESDPLIDSIALQGGVMDISVCVGNEMICEDIRLLQGALARSEELLDERLRRLSDILKAMGY